MEFRVAEPTDALCIGVLAMQVFLDTYATEGVHPDLAREALVNYSPEAFEARLRDSSRWFLLAERAGHLVAFAECSLSSSPPLPSLSGGVELVRLYVQGPSQRSGVGAALLARAEAHARRCCAPLLWLTAWVGNTNALAFYRAQGCEEVGSTCYAFEAKTYENRIYRKILTNRPELVERMRAGLSG